MTDKTAILDCIDIRFAVDASIDISYEGEKYHAKTSFSLTCGVYSRIPDKENIAALINDRGIYDYDIDDLTGTGTALTKEKAAELIMETGLSPKQIDNARIVEVLVDEKPVAEAL